MEQYNQIQGRLTEPSQPSQYNLLRDNQINIPNINTYRNQNQMRMNNFSLNNNVYIENDFNNVQNPFARHNQENNNIINQNNPNNRNNQNLNPFQMANPNTNEVNQILPSNNQNYMNQFPNNQNGFDNNNNMYQNNPNMINQVAMSNIQDNNINNINNVNMMNNQPIQNFDIQNNPNYNNPNIQINQNNPNFNNNSSNNMNMNINNHINYNNNNDIINNAHINNNINDINNNNINNINCRIIQRGNKFNSNEINTIIKISYDELMQRSDPLSKCIIEKIKNIFKGEWVVFVSAVGLKGYDLSVSVDDENRLISFIIDFFRFQIIKIAD